MIYKKYICLVCGFIYDEKTGVPDDDIKPYTKWKDISDDWFYENFIKKLNSSSRCRIYIDSCFSEGFLDLKYKYLNNGTMSSLESINDENIASVVSLTSSKEDQQSYSSYLSGQYNGIFTYNLCEKINTIGNFDIKLAFKLIENRDLTVNQNIMICSTFKFEREPILLL